MILWDTYFESARQMAESGEHGPAVELLASALEETDSEEVRDDRWLSTLLAMAHSLTVLGRWDDAAGVLTVSPELSAACSPALQLALAESQGEVFAHLGRGEEEAAAWERWFRLTAAGSADESLLPALKRVAERAGALNAAWAGDALALQQTWAAELLGSSHPEVLAATRQLALVSLEQGRMGQAESLTRAWLEGARASGHPEEQLEAERVLARLLRAQGKADEAWLVGRRLLQTGSLDEAGSLDLLSWASESGLNYAQWGELARTTLADADAPTAAHHALLHRMLDTAPAEDRLLLLELRGRWSDGADGGAAWQAELARALESSGDRERAWEAWQKLLDAPDVPAELLAEARLRAARRTPGEGVDALELYRVALHPHLHQSGWSVEWLGDFGRWAELERFHGHYPQAQSVYRALLDCYDRMGLQADPVYAAVMLREAELGLASGEGEIACVRLDEAFRRWHVLDAAERDLHDGLEACRAAVGFAVSARLPELYEPWAARLRELGEEPLPFDRPFDPAAVQEWMSAGDWGRVEAEMRDFASGLGPSSPPEHFQSLLFLSECLEQQGKWEDALSTRQLSQARLAEALGPDHELTLRGQLGLGLTFNALSRFAEGERVLSQAVRQHEKIYGSDSLELGRTLLALSESFRLQGKDNLTEAVAGRAVGLLEKHLPVGHPERLQAKRDLVQWLMDQGRFNEARQQLEFMQGEEVEAFGPDHPELAVTLSQWAGLETAVGNYVAAEASYRRSLQLFELGLGDSHPNVAATLNNLGQNLYRQARHVEAAEHLKRALAVFEESDPGRVSTIINLGLVLHAQGLHAAAQECLEQALALSQQWLGDDDLESAFCRFTLADVLAAQGDYEHALEMARSALQLRERRLGALHPETAASQTQLGTLLSATGRPEEALPLVQGSLQVQVQALGSDHPELVPTYAALGRLYLQAERWAEAEETLGRALSLMGRSTTQASLEVAQLIGEFGRLRSAQGQAREAVSFTARAADLMMQVLGAQHEATDAVLVQLAECYAQAGQTKEAEACWKRLLAQRGARLGADHARVVEAWMSLARLQHSVGRSTHAETMARKALELTEKRVGLDAMELIEPLGLLLELAEAQGAEDKAAALLDRMQHLVAPDFQEGEEVLPRVEAASLVHFPVPGSEQVPAAPNPISIPTPTAVPTSSAIPAPITMPIPMTTAVANPAHVEAAFGNSAERDALPDISQAPEQPAGDHAEAERVPEPEAAPLPSELSVSAGELNQGDRPSAEPLPLSIEADMTSATVEAELAGEARSANSAVPVTQPTSLKVEDHTAGLQSGSEAPEAVAGAELDLPQSNEAAGSPAVSQAAPQGEPAMPALAAEPAETAAPSAADEPSPAEEPLAGEPQPPENPPVEAQAEPHQAEAAPAAQVPLAAEPAAPSANAEAETAEPPANVEAETAEPPANAEAETAEPHANAEAETAEIHANAEARAHAEPQAEVAEAAMESPSVPLDAGVNTDLEAAEPEAEALPLLPAALESDPAPVAVSEAPEAEKVAAPLQLQLPTADPVAPAAAAPALSVAAEEASGSQEAVSDPGSRDLGLKLATRARLEERAASQSGATLAETQRDLARLERELGNLQAAEKLVLSSLATWTQLEEGENRPEVAAAMLDLAELYLATGRPEPAEGMIRRATEIQVRVRGPEHPSMVEWLLRLGSLYLPGRPAQALPALQRAATLAKDHLSKADPLYPELFGQLAEAEELCGHMEAAVAAREAQVTSPGFRDHAPGLCRQGVLLVRAGKFGEAIPLLSRLEGRLAELDPGAQESLWAALGHALLLSGRGEEAEGRLLAALEARARRLGPDHAEILPLALDLARLGHERGADHQVAIFAQQALGLLADDQKTERLRVVRMLAPALQRAGRSSEAEAALRLWLSLIERDVDGIEPMVLLAANLDSRARSETLEALNLREQALALSTAAGRPPGEGVGVELLELMARGAAAHGLWEKAEAWLRRAYSMVDKQDPGSAARLALRLGEVFRATGRLAEAETAIRRSLDARQALGADHPETLHTLQTLAEVYLDQGRADAAQSMLQRALDQGKRSWGEASPELASFHRSLGLLLAKTGRRPAAEAELKRALELVSPAVDAPPHPEQVAALQALGEFYLDSDQPALARPLFEQALQSIEDSLGASRPEAADTLLKVADSQRRLGQAAAAEPLLRRAREIRAAHHPADHPRLAEVNLALAGALTEKGDRAEVRALLESALQTYSQGGSAQSARAADCLEGLARLELEQSRFAEAEAHLQRAVLMRDMEPDGSKEALIVTQQLLAQVYLESRRPEGAEKALKRALELAQRLPGNDRPEAATCLEKLGHLYLSQGRYVAAEALFDRALEIGEGSGQPQHASSIPALLGLARIYLAQNGLAQAYTTADQARKLCDELPQQPNLRGAEAHLLLAESLRAQGKVKESEAFYSRGLEALQKLRGGEHPDVARGLHGLATLLAETGRVPQAERIFTHALRLLEAKFGPLHPALADSLHSLGLLARAQGQGPQAELLLKRALDLRTRGLGSEHPDLAASLQAMAQLHADQRNDEAAELMLKQAISIREKALRADHPSLSSALLQLAALLKSQERFDEAEPRLKRVLDQREKLLGSGHLDTVGILQQLGELHLLSGRLQQAETFLRRALEILERRLGSDHVSLLPVLHLLSDALTRADRAQEASAVRSRIQLMEVGRPKG